MVIFPIYLFTREPNLGDNFSNIQKLSRKNPGAASNNPAKHSYAPFFLKEHLFSLPTVICSATSPGCPSVTAVCLSPASSTSAYMAPPPGSQHHHYFSVFLHFPKDTQP